MWKITDIYWHDQLEEMAHDFCNEGNGDENDLPVLLDMVNHEEKREGYLWKQFEHFLKDF